MKIFAVVVLLVGFVIFCGAVIWANYTIKDSLKDLSISDDDFPQGGQNAEE